jgi:ABC-type phosphate/phosphonate transport system substrate-binding protein
MKRLSAILAVALTCVALAGCIFGPRAEKNSPPNTSSTASGTTTSESPEQAAVLEALRASIEAKLGQPVVFKVKRITIADNWAFVQGQTVQPNGDAIDYSQTAYKEAVAQGAFDDGFAALLRFEAGAWNVVTFNIGATDVPWVEWPAQYGAPTSVVPPT